MPDQSPITRPPLPDRVGRLGELASDIWWVWNPAARSVFRELDYGLWRSSAHNPVRLLRLVPAERLEQAARDPIFLARYDQAIKALDRARSGEASWWTQRNGPRPGPRHRLLLGRVRAAPVAADLRRRPRRAGRRPLQGSERPRPAVRRHRLHVSAGLLPPERLVRRLAGGALPAPGLGRRPDRAGASRPTASPASSPCRSASAPCSCRCGTCKLGHTQLYLLDTDLEENAPWDRELSARLYGGDRETRIQQEIILGIGGVRALRALGLDPAVWHLNEGHAGFVVLQRIHEFLDQGLSFEDALDARPPEHGLHHAHAGPGRPRRLPLPPGRDAPRRLLGPPRRSPRGLPRARPPRQRPAARSST